MREVLVWDPVAMAIIPREELRRRQAEREPARRKADLVHHAERGRWIWDPDRQELVPAAEWQRRPTTISPQVMSDINPYQSVITGETIGSRSQHRDHLRAHGVEEFGNEKIQEPKPYKAKDVAGSIRRAMQEVGGFS